MHIYIYKVRNGEFQIRMTSDLEGASFATDTVLLAVSSKHRAIEEKERAEHLLATRLADMAQRRMSDDGGPGGLPG